MKRFFWLILTVFLVASCNAQNKGKVTIQYKQDEKVNPSKLSLDIYPSQKNDRPVVVFVHGGGWLLGDKDTKMQNKISFFSKLDYVLVSVNYRLSSFFSKKTQFPDHTNDVADAVKWVYDNISKYGGDKNNMVLLGHSAGAQMVSLLGTSPEFLPNRGIQLSQIKGIVSLDTEGYDVYGLGIENVNIYRRIFGDDSEVWKRASPLYQVTSEGKYPPFLIAYRGEAYRHTMAENFTAKLKSAGTDVTLFSAEPYSHFEVNNKFGEEDERIVTPRVLNFLQKVFPAN